MSTNDRIFNAIRRVYGYNSEGDKLVNIIEKALDALDEKKGKAND